jgi:single-strand DNA-binding protein
MHYFDDKNCLGRFPLATNEEYVNKSTNERVTNTEWHSIVVRNKAAEICEKYLHKGDLVYIEGQIKTRKWTDDRGNDRYSTEIHCTEFNFLTPKNKSGDSSQPQTQDSQALPQKTQPQQVNEPDENNEDDLPF